ncbi:hypothetical protein IMCC26134_14350 [Verrucomicrobia bacterium IMCC26134]|nr:hypothetical protein IMCC26134_14350 [Verrucomicrobia bacterium IMCC26134]
MNSSSGTSACLILALLCGSPFAGLSAEAALIHHDHFDRDLSAWVVEQAPGGTTSIVEDQLDVDDAKGCTVWFREKLTGPIRIEFDATLIQQGGPNDRVSDLNCFWMATDPAHPEDLFANSKARAGSFKNYDALRLYYVGYGANDNKTTRLRRYPGDGTKPLLPEHDLNTPEFMNVANRTLKIQVVADGSRIRFVRDGQTVFDFTDAAPFTSGWFGFRTVRSHLRLDNFRVYRLAR